VQNVEAPDPRINMQHKSKATIQLNEKMGKSPSLRKTLDESEYDQDTTSMSMTVMMIEAEWETMGEHMGPISTNWHQTHPFPLMLRASR